MVDDRRKFRFDWTVKVSDIVLFTTIIIGILYAYFAMNSKITEHEIWIKEESKPFHTQTKESLQALDKQQVQMVEQLKNLNQTLQEIKIEIREARRR